jgi:hypothetical protein
MTTLIAYLVMIAVAGATISIAYRPSVAIGLLIGMYAAEQLLTPQLGFLGSDSTVFNFFVGVVCLFAATIALIRKGVPRVPTELAAVFSGFFLVVTLSLAWTTGPKLGTYWITHFIAEIPLSIILPIMTIRRLGDIKPMCQLVVLLAFCAALGFVTSPLTMIMAGRTLLTDEGTILSPAELTGAGLILIALLPGHFLGMLARFRVPIGVLLAIGTLVSGARGQFIISVVLVTLIVIARQYSTQMAGIVATIGIVVASAVAAIIWTTTEIVLPGFQSSDRFSSESISDGIAIRLDLLYRSLDATSPIFGNGIGSWSRMFNGFDLEPRLIESLTVHPHNSLAQSYYETGVVGLGLFVWLIAIGLRHVAHLRQHSGEDRTLASLSETFGAYLAYSFLLSLKQSTFLACSGVYVSVAILSVLAGAANRQASLPIEQARLNSS